MLSIYLCCKYKSAYLQTYIMVVKVYCTVSWTMAPISILAGAVQLHTHQAKWHCQLSYLVLYIWHRSIILLYYCTYTCCLVM
jgi:Na+-translocating ferredoxin:NAD+ oxidoreductase RnfD subunit